MHNIFNISQYYMVESTVKLLWSTFCKSSCQLYACAVHRNERELII